MLPPTDTYDQSRNEEEDEQPTPTQYTAVRSPVPQPVPQPVPLVPRHKIVHPEVSTGSLYWLLLCDGRNIKGGIQKQTDDSIWVETPDGQETVSFECLKNAVQFTAQ